MTEHTLSTGVISPYVSREWIIDRLTWQADSRGWDIDVDSIEINMPMDGVKIATCTAIEREETPNE